MRLPWKRRTILTKPKPVCKKQFELEAGKQILSEAFRIRPDDVEDMILQRLEEKS